MPPQDSPSGVARFGPFEIDLGSGEIRKQGRRVHLEGQPLRILTLLVLRGGEPVSREELREQLWSGETFVDFEQGLNSAIKRLRAALGDSGRMPQFIERMPKRGYRLMVVPTMVAAAGNGPVAAVPVADTPPPRAEQASSWRRPLVAIVAVCAIAAIATIAIFIYGRRLRPGGGLPATSIRSIVVLPFDTASERAEDSSTYIAFGVTDALTTELTRLTRLRVVSETSARRYGNRDTRSVKSRVRSQPMPSSRDRCVLEGSMVRVTVQLLDGATDSHLWAQSYTRERGSLLALQLEIAQAVAREVGLRLTPDEQTRLAARRTVSADVEQAYLEGRYFARLPDEANQQRAEQAFERGRLRATRITRPLTLASPISSS